MFSPKRAGPLHLKLLKSVGYLARGRLSSDPWGSLPAGLEAPGPASAWFATGKPFFLFHPRPWEPYHPLFLSLHPCHPGDNSVGVGGLAAQSPSLKGEPTVGPDLPSFRRLTGPSGGSASAPVPPLHPSRHRKQTTKSPTTLFWTTTLSPDRTPDHCGRDP